MGVEVQSITNEEVGDFTSEEFKVLFKKEYVPMVEIERVTKEFLSMEQTTESVNELTAKFHGNSLFCP